MRARATGADDPISGIICRMNDESLQRANDFLATVASRVEVGEVLQETPAEIGRELGHPDPLSTARAVRALISRRRLEPANGSYRLLDARPVDPEEREALGRRPRDPDRPRRRPGRPRSSDPSDLAYSDLGRAVAAKLIELGRENAEMRAELRQAREELREARVTRDEADRRARSLGERTKELEARAEMAEGNLRSLLATARGREVKPDAPVQDAEIAAILGVLKGDEDAPEPVEERAEG
jgi:hypothetical protein